MYNMKKCDFSSLFFWKKEGMILKRQIFKTYSQKIWRARRIQSYRCVKNAQVLYKTS